MKTKQKSSQSKFRARCAIFAALLFCANLTQAANSTWLNVGTDFNTAENWSDGVPGAGNQANFDTPMETNPNLSSSLSIGQLRFPTTSAAGYTLSADPGQTLTLSTSDAISSSNSSGTNAITADLILSGGGTKNILQSGNGTLLLTGNISESVPGTSVTFVRVSAAFPTFVVTGLNTFSGVPRLADGVLRVNSFGNAGFASSFGSASVINLGTAGSSRAAGLTYIGPGETSDKVIDIGAGSGGRTINTTGASGGLVLTSNIAINGTAAVNFTLSGDSHGNVLQGVIGNPAGNAASLVKAGSGTWTLAGDNTYAGTTTLNSNGGTLLINGDQSAATGNVILNSGTTLGGSGIVGGNTTIVNASTVAPGDGVGTLTFAGNLTLNGGASVIFEGGDLIAVAGHLTLINNWTLRLTGEYRNGGSMTLFTYGTLGENAALVPNIDASALGFAPSEALSLTDTGTSIVLNGLQLPAESATIIMLR